MEGLPEKFERQYWTRGPANRDHRNPVSERYASTLDVVIRDSIFRAIEGEGRGRPAGCTSTASIGNRRHGRAMTSPPSGITSPAS